MGLQALRRKQRTKSLPKENSQPVIFRIKRKTKTPLKEELEMNYELEQNYANEYAKERKRDHNYLFICLHLILVCTFLKTRSES